MLTRWSTHLLFDAIFDSSVEMLAELKVDSVSAAVDIPVATRSKNCLSRVTTSYCGKASRMFSKSLTLSASQDLLISATSLTWVQKGLGHFSMELCYWLKIFIGVASSC